MARTVTLDQLRSRIRWQADVSGLTLRHTNADLTTEINQSVQRFREMISDNGFQYYLRTATGTLPVGKTAPYPFGVLDLSAVSPNVVRVFGIDVTVNSTTHSLDAVDFAERTRYQYPDGPTGGVPVAFTMWTDTNVAILPPSQTAYPYVLWYLPVQTNLVADADTFDGKVGWEDWIVWDGFHKLIHRDTYPALFASVATERANIQQDILKRSRHLQRQGPAVKRDTRGDKRSKMLLARRTWLR